MRAFGPADDVARPAVLLFHGCGGLRAHLPLYAQAASDAGVRAFLVDSYGPRSWSPAYARMAVCTGARFWGRERAGDVLAALHGLGRRSDVDADRIVLAGWSHGSWAIMDLMTMALDAPGQAGLQDPDPAPLDGVRGLFLAYPYGGFGALSRTRPWLRSPPISALLCGRDHVTRPADARRLYEAARRSGADVDLHELPDATHSFDEPTGVPPMRHRADLTGEAVERFRLFLQSRLESPGRG